MRKSNWIIVGLLVVASIIFLVMWYVLGFNYVDNPLDLVISIIWWAVIIVVCVLIHMAEKRRRRSIRTTFISPGVLYNPEAGVVQLEEGQTNTEALRRILSSLDYDFDREDVDEDQRIRFKQIVRSDKFKDSGNTWSGEVVFIIDPNDPIKFNNAQELARLIDAA